MKFNTFCIVAGSEACTGGCKWCVAAMTTARSIHRGKAKPIDERIFRKACQMAQQSGLDTARITGKGAFYMTRDRGDSWEPVLKDTPSVLTAWVSAN